MLFLVFILIWSIFIYSPQFINICVILCKIHIYFLIGKLYLFKSAFQKQHCHSHVGHNVATNMLNCIVINTFEWFSLPQIHRRGNIVLYISVISLFSIYLRSLPLPFCIDMDMDIDINKYICILMLQKYAYICLYMFTYIYVEHTQYNFL